MIKAQLSGEQFQKITALQFIFADGNESPVFKPGSVEITNMANYTIEKQPTYIQVAYDAFGYKSIAFYDAEKVLIQKIGDESREDLWYDMQLIP